MQREETVNKIISELSLSNGVNRARFPSKKKVRELVRKIQIFMFEGPFEAEFAETEMQRKLAFDIYDLLLEQLNSICSQPEAEGLSAEIMELLPEIKNKLLKDAIAIYEGDPAATSKEEVILSYPGFYAISVYRLAHEFYLRKIALIPRIMTELAHEKTGIDIHPGASIGESFCIDHGTGVVIGETAVIGNNVKIYQGVTLGAKSFQLGEDGNPIKGVKRHPRIGNNCIIYAGATILGGNTVIGDGCVIGGNVRLTHSVPPKQSVY